MSRVAPLQYYISWRNLQTAEQGSGVVPASTQPPPPLLTVVGSWSNSSCSSSNSSSGSCGGGVGHGYRQIIVITRYFTDSHLPSSIFLADNIFV